MKKYSLKWYIWNFVVAIDQLFNALLGGFADETFSSRAYRWYAVGKFTWVMKLIDSIFFFEKKHCYESYVYEKEKKHSSHNF